MTLKIITFFKEVRLEIEKVNWPARTQIIRYTMIIVGISGAVAFFLGGLDFIFTFMINQFIL